MSQTSQVLPAKRISTWWRPLIPAMIILGGTFLVALIFGLLIYQIYFLERIHEGVRIGDQSVSRMTRYEAGQVVAAQTDILLNRSLTLVSPEGTFTLPAAQLGARVDLEKTVDLAFSVGRQGSLMADLRAQWQTMQTPVTIVPVITFDTGPANNIMLNLSRTLNTEPRDAQLILHNDLSVEVIPAQNGRTVDVETSRSAIKKAILLRDETPIELTIITIPPLVSTAEPARRQLELILSRPLSLTFNDRTWLIPPEMLAGFISIGPEIAPDGQSGQIALAVNQAPLITYFYNLALEINQTPINAWFHLDVDTWALIPLVASRDGYTLDVATGVAQVTEWLNHPDASASLVLPVQVNPPAVPAATAEALGIQEPVAEATTYFKGSSVERMQNIQVAASKFHGLVIPPGEVFSFNQHLGEIIPENGFVDSLIIQGERTAVGIGGGVCQVSTTAFRAALYGGFEIIERWAHGYRVSWYETGSVPGLDATIYSPLVDFKFRNDTPHYLLIQTNTDLEAGTVTFTFYGTASNRTVSVTEPVKSNIAPHGPDIYQEDPALKPGEKKQVDWAVDGVDITIERTVTEGETIIHHDTFVSHYQPWQNVFKIGPKPDNPGS